jgi:hypothetical protein
MKCEGTKNAKRFTILYAYMLYICIVLVYSQLLIRQTSQVAKGSGEGKTFIKMLYITNVLDPAEYATVLSQRKQPKEA